MQGQRSAIGSLPDSIDFDFGSTSSNVGIDQQIFWNNLSNVGNGNQGGQNPSQWTIGESSSNNLQNPIDHVGQSQTTQHGWPQSMGSSDEPTVGSSRAGINLNLNMSQISSGPSSESDLEPSASSSGNDQLEELDGRSGFALDGRRSSCKRKTTEGQSSNSISPHLEASGNNPSPANSRHELNMVRVIPDDIAAVSRIFRLRMQESLNVGQSNPSLELGSRRDIHTVRLNRALQSRAGNSSTSLVDSPVQQDLNLRPRPRTMPGHPLLNVVHSPAAVARHVGSGSRAGPSWGSAHDHPPQYLRRASEYVRRNVISTGGSEARALGGSSSLNRPVPSSSQELVLPASGRTQWMERHGDGAIGIPYSLRALSTGGEGRRLISEIRSVLDTIRRGEGFRFEDAMMLDPSVLFGMADVHDQHRDMRLDVDNMSYEELLALEERIGNVRTGLSSETIAARMKQREHVSTMKIDQAELEPCCICQEEYDDGEVLGTLDCGHDFHSGCIRQWLEQKNMCPICKATALSA